MATHITVKRLSTIAHLDSRSEVHAEHKALSAEARKRKSAILAETPDARHVVPLKFPCLGGGVLLRADGSEMGQTEHLSLLKRLVKERGFYLREELRADGRTRLRKRATNGLRNLAISFRPDHAALLSRLSNDPVQGALVRRHIVDCSKMLGNGFTGATGLEVVAMEVHPESAVLHVHLGYTTVNSQNRLLWPAGGAGRKGLRFLGPWHTGCLRLCRAGYLPVQAGRLAEIDLARVRERHGGEAIDWALTQSLDEKCSEFVRRNGLEREFQQESANYRAALIARRANSPKGLAEAARNAAAQRDEAFAEIRALRGRLNAANQLLLRSSTLVQPQSHPRNQTLVRSL